MKKFFLNHKLLFVFIFISFIFFSSSLVLTFDSSHYLGYVDIFEGNSPFSNWDVVRGPIFPMILYLIDLIFGKTSTAMVLGMFIFYIIYCLVIYKFSDRLFKNNKYKKQLIFLLCGFSFFNPIILGYYHTMLTEFVAITLTTVSLFISWKWWNTDSKKRKIIYSMICTQKQHFKI